MWYIKNKEKNSGMKRVNMHIHAFYFSNLKIV